MKQAQEYCLGGMVAPFKPGADHYIKVVQRCLVMFNVRYRTPWRHVTPLTQQPLLCANFNETQRHVCMESFTVGDQQTSPDIQRCNTFVTKLRHINVADHIFDHESLYHTQK